MDKSSTHDRHRLSIQNMHLIKKTDLTIEERSAYERIQKNLIQQRRFIFRWRLLERLIMVSGLILILMTGWGIEDKYEPTMKHLASSMLHEHVFLPEDGDWFDSIRKHTKDSLYTIPFPSPPWNEDAIKAHVEVLNDTETMISMNPHVIWIHLEGRSGTQLIRWTEGEWR